MTLLILSMVVGAEGALGTTAAMAYTMFE